MEPLLELDEISSLSLYSQDSILDLILTWFFQGVDVRWTGSKGMRRSYNPLPSNPIVPLLHLAPSLALVNVERRISFFTIDSQEFNSITNLLSLKISSSFNFYSFSISRTTLIPKKGNSNFSLRRSSIRCNLKRNSSTRMAFSSHCNPNHFKR